MPRGRPHIVFTSPNLLSIVSTRKIVPSFEAGLQRILQHIIPLEDQRMRRAYGVGTGFNKFLVFRGEKAGSGRTIRLILVEQDLGF